MNQSESSLCRVFLVDDDLLVLDDLRELIAWEAEGFEIIGTAGTGEQALAQLARTPADLVFVDIEMPRLNGLDFIRRLRQIDPQVQTLLLTAFSRFDYAREAVSLGVYNYILKHELTAEVLLENLRGMREQRKQRKAASYLDEQTRFRQLLWGNDEGALDSASGPFSSHKGIGLVCLRHLPSLDELSHPADTLSTDVFLASVQQALLPLRKIRSFLVFPQSAQELWFAVEADQPGDSVPYEFCTALREALENKLTPAGFFVSPIAPDRQELRRLYRLMNQRQTQLFYFAPGRITLLHECPTFDPFDAADWEVRLTQTDTLAALRPVLSVFLDALAQHRPPLPQVLLAIKLMLQKLQKMLPAAVLADDNFSQWKTISTFQELNAFVHRWLPALETQAQTSRKTSFMLNYLQEHCADENVLDDLSQTLQMNREYLSKLLKKETGQTLAQTLLDLRLQKAMRLLKQNDLKIYEVAQRCGFHSSQYFAIVFYKKYHVYPSDILKEPYA